MSLTLAPIPQGVGIVDKVGAITDFFRLRWQSLIDSILYVPIINTKFQKTGQTAALTTVSIYTTKQAGWYRITFYARVTTAAGTSSSLQVTVGWTETTIPLTESAAALTGNTTGTEQSGSKTVWADGATDITIATTYASVGLPAMAYRLDASVEALL